MTIHGSSGTYQETEMGFPVAATIGAASTIAASVLPTVLGGGGDRLSRREQILRQRAVQRKMEAAQSEIQTISADQLTVEEAKEIQNTGAEHIRDVWFARWRSQMADLPNGTEVARQIAEDARQAYLNAASWKLLKAEAPQLIGVGAGVLGAGALLYSSLSTEEA